MPQVVDRDGSAGDRPGSSGGLESPKVIETHTGVVFLVGTRAYKLKKPVSFSFLDFSRREIRRAACEREVTLNRRLAPDVYDGVLDVIGSDGVPCDHLVSMRRMPADRCLAAMVAGGQPVDEEVRRIARLMADFHARADRSTAIDDAAGRYALESHWEQLSSDMQPLVGTVLDGEPVARADRLARRYLAGRQPLFAERVAAGWACDGHGDLIANDIFCLDDGPRVLDCLEFDDHLRWGDALADVAFLAMDLEHLGRPDLAATFLRHYREYSMGTWPTSLAHHYIAERAQVRALVNGLRANQGDEAMIAPARRLLDLCLAHLEAARVRLVVVGGLPGTGKSTVADLVAHSIDAVVLRSDEVRKQRAGLDITVHRGDAFGTGLYEADATSSTYAELLEQARVALSHGTSVVLDATFGDPIWRTRARSLAAGAFADLDELRCTAPPAIVERRIRQRSARGRDASDATVAIARQLAADEVPWPTATAVDTSSSLHDVERVLAALLQPIQGEIAST